MEPHKISGLVRWLEGFFFWCSVLILSLAVIGKLFFVWVGHSYLERENQVFVFLKNGTLFYAIIIVEVVAIGALLFFRRRGRLLAASSVLGWLLLAFTAYRSALAVVGAEQDCRCFGILADVLNGKSALVIAITNGSLVVFTLAIVSTLLSLCIERRRIVRKPAAMEENSLGISRKALLFVWLVVSPHSLLGGTVRLEGVLQFSFFRNNGTLFTNQNASFALERGGSDSPWELQVMLPSGGQWQYFSTGADLVGGYYGKFSDPSVVNPPQPVTARRGCNPLDNYYVQFPWLAFLTESCAEEDLPAPWLDAEYQPEAHAYRTAFSPYGQPPGLPEGIVFVSDNERIENAPNSKILHREGVDKKLRGQTRQAVSIPPNVNSAEYKALSWANLGGLSFPTEFRLSKFQDTGDPGSPRKVQFLFVGKLTNWTDSSGQLRPPVFTNTIVHDRRFRDERRVVDFIRYRLDNQSLPKVSDTNLVVLFEQKLAAAPLNVSNSTRRLVVYTIFALLLIVPMGIHFWVRSLRQKQKTNKTE